VRHFCDWQYPTGPNGESLPSYAVNHRAISLGNLAKAHEFIATSERFMTPAPDHILESWLAELSVITAARADDVMTQEMRLAAYRKRLSEYPADVAREAMFGKTWRFFPTWDELEIRCEAFAGPRRAMAASLAVPLSSAKPAMPTEEQRASIKAQMGAYLARRAAAKAQDEADSAPRIDPFVPGCIPSHIRPDDLRLAKAQDAGSDWRKAGGSAI
jgi:hypothetical protein